MGSELRLSVEPEGTNVLDRGERAGDEQRAKIAAHLHECYALGYIDEDEKDRRESLVMDMRKMPTRDHLSYMIRDLPPMKAQRRFIAKTTRRDNMTTFLKEKSPRLLVLQLLTLLGSICAGILPWTAQAGAKHMSALGVSAGAGCTCLAVVGTILSIVWIVTVWD